MVVGIRAYLLTYSSSLVCSDGSLYDVWTLLVKGRGEGGGEGEEEKTMAFLSRQTGKTGRGYARPARLL